MPKKSKKRMIRVFDCRLLHKLPDNGLTPRTQTLPNTQWQAVPTRAAHLDHKALKAITTMLPLQQAWKMTRAAPENQHGTRSEGNHRLGNNRLNPQGGSRSQVVTVCMTAKRIFNQQELDCRENSTQNLREKGKARILTILQSQISGGKAHAEDQSNTRLHNVIG